MDFQLTKEDWEKQQTSIKRIENALLGDKEMGTTGIVYKVNQHEKKLKEVEDLKNKGWGFISAFVIMAGIVGTSIIEGVKYIFNHH